LKIAIAAALLGAVVLSMIVPPSVLANDQTPGTSGGTAKTVSSPATLNPAPSFTFANSAFVQAGVGLRNAGNGTISVHSPGGVVQKALLYWTEIDTGTLTTPTHPIIDKTATFNGLTVTGTLIGSDISPCWTGNIYIYRADVTGKLTNGEFQKITLASARKGGISPWDASSVLPMVDSAHLIIVYKTASTTSTVQVFDASGTTGNTIGGGSTSFVATFPAYASHPASVGYAVADGQLFGSNGVDKDFKWQTNSQGSPTILAMGQIYGRDPSPTSLASVRGSLSDTQQYDLSSFFSYINAGDTSATLTWDFGGDCLTTVAVTTQT